MDERRWRIFLSLQGNDENTSPPDKDIVIPLKDVEKSLNDFDIFSHFPLPKFKNIMIIGAGCGGEVVSFLNRGYNAKGICLHHSDKKFAKNEYGVDLIIEDMHDMASISSDCYDGVYSYHSLEHSVAPIIALFEIRRILKIDGKLIFIVPSPDSDDEIGIQHYSVLREKHWEHLLEIIGFGDINVNKISGVPIGNITIEARKINKDCPGTYFEKEIEKMNDETCSFIKDMNQNDLKRLLYNVQKELKEFEI